VITWRQHWRQTARIPERWLFCGVLALSAAAMTCWPGGLAYFRYDRAALLAGQYWRLAGAHFVHLNGMHLLLNLVGLILLCELLWHELPLRHGAGALATGGLTASALLFWLNPAVAWYVGMSGALHGLWAGCALASLFPANRQLPLYPATPTSAWRRLQREWPLTRWAGLAGVALLLAKLVLETGTDTSAWAAQAIGAAIVTPAHRYGALGGAAYILLWRAWLRLGPDRNP